jgi:hypothetical protein
MNINGLLKVGNCDAWKKAFRSSDHRRRYDDYRSLRIECARRFKKNQIRHGAIAGFEQRKVPN